MCRQTVWDAVIVLLLQRDSNVRLLKLLQAQDLYGSSNGLTAQDTVHFFFVFFG